MAGNSWGTAFRVTTFGESHGPAVGAIVDGCPAGVALDTRMVQAELDRRRPGQSALVTQRREADTVELLSGVADGRTLGTPICLVVRNTDARSADYDALRDVYRPSHADYTYDAKYGHRAWSGGGRASARETVGRVAAGAVARQWLASEGVEILAWVSQIGPEDAAIDPDAVSRAAVEANPVRCPDSAAAERMRALIETVRGEGDSVGGVIGFVVRGVPAGLGEPVFDKLEADLAKAMLSIPAAKGFESGSGFAGTRQRGSAHNDPFLPPSRPGGPLRTTKNDSGGIQGGISNGQPVLGRVAFKPTATINAPQQTVTTAGEATTLAAKGRHDPCVLPRAVPIVEAMLAIVLADHWLRNRASRATDGAHPEATHP